MPRYRIRRSGLYSPAFVASGGGGASAAYNNFVARTSGGNLGGDTTAQTNYQNLLDGLTTDGIFDGSGNSTLLDALYILAAPNSTTSLLNLVKSSFPLTVHGGPTFTTNRGFQAGNGGTDWLATAFNPTTASSPNYVQNSAHISVWNRNNATDGNGAMGNADAATSGECNIYVKFNGDNKFYTRINDGTESAGVVITNPIGWLLGNRSAGTGSNDIQQYQGVSGTLSLLSNQTQNSASPANAEITILRPGTGSAGSTLSHQIAASTIGASLSSTNANLIYQRLQTFMTAVGA